MYHRLSTRVANILDKGAMAVRSTLRGLEDFGSKICDTGKFETIFLNRWQNIDHKELDVVRWQ